MGDYTIKDLERLSGIKAHTIRIWEKRYGVISPGRTTTNRRRYSDDDLRKLINISILNRSGFKISRIASMSIKEMEEKVSLISKDIAQADTGIESLIVAMISLDEAGFNELIESSIKELGLEKAFIGLIFPFLERVGILWVTGSIVPAQEHFVSNLIRQKLIAHIDARGFTEKSDAKRVLLYLPENEWHEIGILFYSYLARKHGHRVLYLGSATPLDSLIKAIQVWPAEIIVTATSSGFAGINKEAYLKELSEAFKDLQIIISGTLATDIKGKLPDNIKAVHRTEEFIHLLNG
ncbi:MAG: MerR family transcriptional regulator [Bacteroidales bacterium]|jgi:DNA-binding transcriptional MerR regulator|nr:MerR family transcriptional regulator [Bacteroidales bacterium]